MNVTFRLRRIGTLSNSVYVWWIACLLGVSVYAYVDRHGMNADGMSYLDMASESLRSGSKHLINGYWSPLYPALLSVVLRVFRPAPANVFSVVHLANVLVFGFVLLSFTFFVRSFAAVHNDDDKGAPTGIPYLIPFCFGIFSWFTMEFTRPSSERPDLCVTGIVFLAAALCCRISVDPKWRYFLALGFALGLGYYAKAVMFPLALILLAVLFALPPPGEGARLKVVSTALVFLIVAAPLAALISKRVGHLSIGETGSINYALYVNGLPIPPSWVTGNGAPAHLPRTVLSKPIIMEFATPVRGTNPLGYDPSYWFAGARPHFDPRQQLATIKVNVRLYVEFFSQMVMIVSGALMLYLLIPRGSLRLPDNMFWWFTLWPTAACCIYALVHVEARFLPGFLALFWLALYFFLLQAVDTPARTAVLGTVLFSLLIPTIGHIAKLRASGAADKPEYIRVGDALRGAGIGPGDSIAVAGGRTYETGGRVYRESSAWDAYYARYVGARVIAAIVDANDGIDMPQRQAPEFWHLDPEDLSRVKDLLAGIGVKAIVALDRPDDSTPADWRQVNGTPYSILVLKVPGSENPIAEGDAWINGAAVGLDWANVRTFQGLAFGAQPDFGARYADSTALLTGTWGPDQTVEATVHTVHQNSSAYEEVELRLRSTLSPRRNTGYEVTFRCLTNEAAYAGIARWNGALGNWTSLALSKGAQYGVKDGDIIKAKITGNVITGYLNGVQVVQATDSTYTNGAPGIGFYLEGGPSSAQSDYGFTTFSVTDGRRTYTTQFGHKPR
ncbi:MAG TPA: hypothetical protein VKD70_07590 [Candidatus Acidoferrum sp.]|nr:hypothetical protein [Candidatus Acidoferrum sp.]